MSSVNKEQNGVGNGRVCVWGKTSLEEWVKVISAADFGEGGEGSATGGDETFLWLLCTFWYFTCAFITFSKNFKRYLLGYVEVLVAARGIFCCPAQASL